MAPQPEEAGQVQRLLNEMHLTLGSVQHVTPLSILLALYEVNGDDHPGEG